MHLHCHQSSFGSHITNRDARIYMNLPFDLGGPAGHVVLSDIAVEMTAIAAARAAELGLRNVTALMLDMEQINEPDGSYDAVICREGLMFAADPARAFAEIHRVLRPGGRLALAVWGPRVRNPWLSLVLDAVSAQVGKPMPPVGLPGPFSLEDGEKLARLMSDAGFANVLISELAVETRVADFDEWWARTSALAGPLAAVLGSMPDAGKQALRARLREAVRPYATQDGFEIPGVTLLASGRRKERLS